MLLRANLLRGEWLAAAGKHALSEARLGAEEVRRVEHRFWIDVGDIAPRVFWRITEDWLEMTVRFLGPDHGIRGIKDKMTRDVLAGFEKDGLAVGVTRQEAVPGPAARKSARWRSLSNLRSAAVCSKR